MLWKKTASIVLIKSSIFQQNHRYNINNDQLFSGFRAKNNGFLVDYVSMFLGMLYMEDFGDRFGFIANNNQKGIIDRGERDFCSSLCCFLDSDGTDSQV